MLDLSRITLFAIDNTHRIEGTIKSLYTSMGSAKFGSVKLVTSKEYKDTYELELIKDNIICEEMIFPVTNIDEYNYYILYELHKHIETDFVLLTQDHAFVINPESWTDEFFEYDYIGAPWPWSENSYVTPFGEHIRSGNGGFSLRSKKLLKETSMINLDLLPFPSKSEDLIICHFLYEKMIAAGIKFPKPELAAQFSIESPSASYGQNPETTFGFHGKFLRDLIFQGIANKKK